MIKSFCTYTYACLSELILDQITLEAFNCLTGKNLTKEEYDLETIDEYLEDLMTEGGDSNKFVCELLEAEEKRLQEKGINIEFYFNPNDVLDIYYLAEVPLNRKMA